MIQWGFIGCGDVVEKKSGKPFWVDGKSTVTAVMTRSLDKAKDFATRYNIPDYYDDGAALIANPEVNAIYIATPPSTHMMYAKMALEAGKPVYVEKPMGCTVAECEEVVALAEEKGLPLFVAFYRRALPYYLAIKKLLDDGELGNIHSVSVRHYQPPQPPCVPWQRDPDISGGGLFHETCCHTIDIMDLFFGPLASFEGLSKNIRNLTPSPDTVTAHFTFENGMVGAGLWSFDAGVHTEEVQIIGEKGTLTFHIFGDTYDITVDGVHRHEQIKHPAFIQESMVHNVIDSLLGLATPASTGVSALRTVKMMDCVK